LAACRVVFREIVGVDKCEQRKGGENYDQYPDKFPFHGLLPHQNQLSLPANAAFVPRFFLVGVETSCANGWDRKPGGYQTAISEAIT
jgi:hypothetical protein